MIERIDGLVRERKIGEEVVTNEQKNRSGWMDQ